MLELVSCNAEAEVLVPVMLIVAASEFPVEEMFNPTTLFPVPV